METSNLISWAKRAKEFQRNAFEQHQALIQISANTQVNVSKELLTLILKHIEKECCSCMFRLQITDEIRKALEVLK